jgi:two-component system response regulator AtoC
MTYSIEPRILVVDDDCNAAAALADLLRDEGYAIQVAHRGNEALVLEKTFHPDLLITDMHMPVMSGVELLSALRQDRRSVPAILMTTDASDAARRRAHDLGASDILDKPLVLPDVLASIQRALIAGTK